MKRYWRSIIETIAIGGLNVGVLMYTIYFALILLYALFSIKPYYTSSNWSFGLTSFEKGIPVKVKFNEAIPDMNIYAKSSKGGTAYYKIYHSSLDHANNFSHGDDFRSNIIYADTISTRYSVLTPKATAVNNFMITGAGLDTGLVNIQTKKTSLRLLFLLPELLGAIIIVACMWQISSLLRSISKGIAFQAINFERLQNVGVLVIAYQAILFFLPVLSFYNVNIDFSSSVPHYRSPLSLNASTDYDFSTSWLIIGTSVLIISSAFKRGEQLQEEQDLTI